MVHAYAMRECPWGAKVLDIELLEECVILHVPHLQRCCKGGRLVCSCRSRAIVQLEVQRRALRWLLHGLVCTTAQDSKVDGPACR